jgi:hypothetical protein
MSMNTTLQRTIISLCALAPLACTATHPTEIVAGISTQIRVPDGLRAVGLTVQTGGEVRFCEHYPVVDNVATLPGSLGVLGATDLGARGTVTVQVVGFRNEDSKFAENCVNTAPESTGLDAMVIRKRRLTFVDDQIKFLPLPLKESCADSEPCGKDDAAVRECMSGNICRCGAYKNILAAIQDVRGHA